MNQRKYNMFIDRGTKTITNGGKEKNSRPEPQEKAT